MAVILRPTSISSAAHKAKMAEIARKVNEMAAITGERTMSVEELQTYQVEVLGIRPEDNGASRELLRMRYGNEYDQDA